MPNIQCYTHMSLLFIYYFVILFFYVSHSWLVTNPVKNKAMNYILPKNYRLFYNLFSIGLLILIFKLYNSMEHLELFSFPGQEIIGWLLMIIGSTLSYISFQAYNTLEFLGLTKENENDQLSITGMNKYVRHPLYSAGLIILWGAILVVPSIGYLGFAIITTIYIYLGTKLEEKKLIKKFGSAYTRYKESVPMLVPRVL